MPESEIRLPFALSTSPHRAHRWRMDSARQAAIRFQGSEDKTIERMDFVWQGRSDETRLNSKFRRIPNR
jgi:hypothetical protein